MSKFKDFLLNESVVKLNSRLGDILTSMHELRDDIDEISPRKLNINAENIVNQIRKILHSQWGSENFPKLKKLQSVGVALMKAIDEKGDVKEVLMQALKEIERLTKNAGVVNNIKMKPQDFAQVFDLSQEKDNANVPQKELPSLDGSQPPNMPKVDPNNPFS